MFRVGYVVLVENSMAWYNPGKWLSLFIELFTGTRYTHCGVISEDEETGELCFNSARKHGVDQESLSDAFTGKNILIRRSKKPVSNFDFIAYSNSFVGKIPYDYWALFVLFPIYLIFNVWLRKEEDPDGKLVCSEYVAVCYHRDKPWECSPESVKIDSGFEDVFCGICKTVI